MLFFDFFAIRQTRSPRRRVMRRNSGAVFIEFAFVLPIFVGLLLSVLQYARLIQATETVTNLSREGARFASLGPGKTDEEITGYINSQISQTALKSEDFTTKIEPVATTLEDAKAIRKEGEKIKVTLTYNLKSRVFLPVISNILLKSYKTGGTDTDPIYQYNSMGVMRIINAY